MVRLGRSGHRGASNLPVTADIIPEAQVAVARGGVAIARKHSLTPNHNEFRAPGANCDATGSEGWGGMLSLSSTSIIGSGSRCD